VPPFLDGVYLGINAVPDAYLLIDCPSGCFFKCERIALNHDLNSSLFDPLGRHRIVQSGINFEDLAMGSEAVLERIARRVRDGAKPPALFLTQSSPVVVTSNDMVTFAGSLAERLAIPVSYLPPRTMDGDYLDGFACFVEALSEVAEKRSGSRKRTAGAAGTDRGEVTLVGYFADRLEEDHVANLAELRRLVGLLGGNLAGVLCGGDSLQDLERAMEAPVLVELPYGGKAARRIADRTGARVVSAPLPVGIGGTERFIGALGEPLGVSGPMLRDILGAELGALMPTLERVRSRFLSDRRAAVAADPAMAGGLSGFLAELGMDVPVVSVRTRAEDRLEEVRQAVAGAGLGGSVVHDLSVPALRQTLEKAANDRELDLLIGSSLERDTACDLGLGFVEIGYPSFVTHALFPRPFLGFAGVRRLADDLVNAVQQLDHERNRARSPAVSQTPPSEDC
jgi:nitrogenase molybdenum-iron protein alpha/beta subunit